MSAWLFDQIVWIQDLHPNAFQIWNVNDRSQPQFHFCVLLSASVTTWIPQYTSFNERYSFMLISYRCALHPHLTQQQPGCVHKQASWPWDRSTCCHQSQCCLLLHNMTQPSRNPFLHKVSPTIYPHTLATLKCSTHHHLDIATFNTDAAPLAWLPRILGPQACTASRSLWSVRCWKTLRVDSCWMTNLSSSTHRSLWCQQV